MNRQMTVDCGEMVQFIDDLLRGGRHVRVRVTGRSMAPWLEDGVCVTLRHVPAAALTTGTVVLYRTGEGRLVLHRVIRTVKTGDGTVRFLVKGDACAAPDGLVAAGQIIGTIDRIARKAPAGGHRGLLPDSFTRPPLDRLLAIASRRSPRLFRALSLRLVPRWRKMRTVNAC